MPESQFVAGTARCADCGIPCGSAWRCHDCAVKAVPRKKEVIGSTEVQPVRRQGRRKSR